MNRRLAHFAFALTAAALFFVATPARAQTTNTLAVFATVEGACTIDPATLTFGNYDPTAALAHDAQGTITVRCTQGTIYWIGLGLGSNPSGSQRQMAGGTGEFLPYELFRDAARTPADVWDNADPGVALHSTASTVAAGFSPYTVDVFGRIPVGQNVSTGAYSDSVTMTVNF